jgi:uncharacterized membrane protein YgdD (TMEM256/DUF423 family)
MHKKFFAYGALSALVAVTIGAFGAHTLARYLKVEEVVSFKTGVEYQFYHSLGIILCGFFYKTYQRSVFKLAAILFFIGIVLFSGSIYLINLEKASSLTVPDWVNYTTPVGGVLFVSGWGILFLHFLMDYKPKDEFGRGKNRSNPE